jgi:hypothetical protein
MYIGFGGHVLGGPDIVEHLRLVSNLFHFAVPEINDGYFFADFWVDLEEDIVGFKIAMHDTFAANLPVSL